MRLVLGIAIVLAIGAGFGVFLRRRARRRANELVQHPERLEQSLDPTDDA